MTMVMGVYFGSASFAHEIAAMTFFVSLVLSYTINILLGKHACSQSMCAYKNCTTIPRGTLTDGTLPLLDS